MANPHKRKQWKIELTEGLRKAEEARRAAMEPAPIPAPAPTPEELPVAEEIVEAVSPAPDKPIEPIPAEPKEDETEKETDKEVLTVEEPPLPKKPAGRPKRH